MHIFKKNLQNHSSLQLSGPRIVKINWREYQYLHNTFHSIISIFHNHLMFEGYVTGIPWFVCLYVEILLCINSHTGGQTWYTYFIPPTSMYTLHILRYFVLKFGKGGIKSVRALQVIERFKCVSLYFTHYVSLSSVVDNTPCYVCSTSMEAIHYQFSSLCQVKIMCFC